MKSLIHRRIPSVELDKLNLTTGKFRSFVRNEAVAGSLSENIINTIFEDDSINLWVGTFGGGLNLLDEKTGRFTVYKNVSSDPSSISNNDVRCIFQDNSGNEWIGTRGGGLDKFYPQDQALGYHEGDFRGVVRVDVTL